MFWPSKKDDNPIYFKEDIIEELSKITGKDKDLLNDIIKHNILYLKRSIQSDNDIVLINFPNLGKMRLNYYLGLCVLSNSGHSRKYNYLARKLKYLKSLLIDKDEINIKNFNKPLLHNSVRRIEKDVPRNIVPYFYRFWKKLEDKHNEDHEKYF